MRLAVFVYDFAHVKSQDFLLKLWLLQEVVECVVAAPHRNLPAKPRPFRVKPFRKPIATPAEICSRFGIPYYQVDHRTEKCAAILRDREIDLGLIAGARILPSHVIAAAKIGIVNFHPGLIPEVRGLDALKWTVYRGVKAGVTAHLIDERVDAGRILIKNAISVTEEDTWFDLSLRLEAAEVSLIPKVLDLLRRHPEPSHYPLVGAGESNTPMSAEQEQELQTRFAAWRKAHAGASSTDRS